MSDDDHKEWQRLKEWHVGKSYGCYMRHPLSGPDGAIKYAPCDYRLKGFNIAKTGARSDMYNKDHLARAKKMGILSDKGKQKMEAQVSALAKKRDKGASWEKNTMARIRNPFGLLERDAEAWHVNHTFTDGKVKPWFGRDRSEKKPPENFLPKPHGGWHFFYPYKHNYHHMIPNRAFRDLVLDAEADGKANSESRRTALLMSKWNINEDTNVILLPNELAVASVCGLPAHCPWETREHPKYTQKIKTDLGKVKEELDKAAKTQDHDDVEVAKLQLESTEEDLLEKIKGMRGTL